MSRTRAEYVQEVKHFIYAIRDEGNVTNTSQFYNRIRGRGSTGFVMDCFEVVGWMALDPFYTDGSLKLKFDDISINRAFHFLDIGDSDWADHLVDMGDCPSDG